MLKGAPSSVFRTSIDCNRRLDRKSSTAQARSGIYDGWVLIMAASDRAIRVDFYVAYVFSLSNVPGIVFISQLTNTGLGSGWFFLSWQK